MNKVKKVFTFSDVIYDIQIRPSFSTSVISCNMSIKISPSKSRITKIRNILNKI